MAAAPQKSEAYQSGQQYLGGVYAKALLGVTEQAGRTSSVLEEFDSLLHDVLDRLPDLETTLASKRIAAEDKERILDQAFAGKMSSELLRFLKVVARHGRLDMLRAIHRAAHRLHDELRGRVRVEIRTAAPLDAETRDLVRTKLQAAMGREVQLSTQVDPELLGGLIVRVGDTVYDGSVTNQLRRMREATLDQALQNIRSRVEQFALPT